MWIAIGIVGGIIGLIVLVAIVGALLPARHICSRRVTLKQPPQTIWDTLVDVDNFPAWRKDVTKVERLADHDGHPVHREHCGGMIITMEQMEAIPAKRLVGRISDKSLPFGGGWTYELQPLDGGTRLTITETGIVRNPIFRFVSRFVMGHSATLDKYLTFLGQKFGEQVTPEPATESNPADWQMVLVE
jgi:uncharacterized protein YndB with AHSA1/START domain